MNELQLRSLGRQIGKRRVNSAFRTQEIEPDSALGLGIESLEKTLFPDLVQSQAQFPES